MGNGTGGGGGVSGQPYSPFTMHNNNSSGGVHGSRVNYEAIVESLTSSD